MKETNQMWHADDSSGAGKFAATKKACALLEEHGPSHGCFPEASKSILVAPNKGSVLKLLQKHLKKKNLRFRWEHERHLGSLIGSTED